MPKTKNHLDTEIGVRLRALRIDQGFSQEQLAVKLGLTFQQVQKYERGTNKLSLSRAVEIAKVLKTSLSALTNGGGETGGAMFNQQAYLLSISISRLHALSPDAAARFRGLIEDICDRLEEKKGAKARGR
jgi:transcriptional regulator with XRE-family HTH domain